MSKEISVQEPKIDKRKAVKVEEFEEFKGQVTATLGTILEKLEGLQSKPEVLAVKAELREAETDEQTPIPLKWRKAVDDILGPEFECELSQPDNGGTIFRIVVPKDKSNAPQIHWQMFKRDVRSREIGNTGLEGVKQWSLKVRANLLASGIKLVQYP